MAQSPLSKCLASPQTKQEEETNQSVYQQFRDHVSTLPAVEGMIEPVYYCYDGWYESTRALVGTMVAQRLFRAKPSDVLLATLPKSGTTWLKSLLFATVYRSSPHYDPHLYLATFSAHDCVPFIEHHVYANNQAPNLELLPSPRLFSTHIPFHSLPKSVAESGCKTVYLCRRPKDNIVSLWQFINSIRAKAGREPFPLEKVFNQFCDGSSIAGPFWDHVLGYWKASLENPDKVLFMRYEELMGDAPTQLKRMAEFVGCRFTADEEKNGVVGNIVNMCGFKKLSSLKVNKEGSLGISGVDNSMLFRALLLQAWSSWRLGKLSYARHGSATR